MKATLLLLLGLCAAATAFVVPVGPVALSQRTTPRPQRSGQALQAANEEILELANICLGGECSVDKVNELLLGLKNREEEIEEDLIAVRKLRMEMMRLVDPAAAAAEPKPTVAVTEAKTPAASESTGSSEKYSLNDWVEVIAYAFGGPVPSTDKAGGEATARITYNRQYDDKQGWRSRRRKKYDAYHKQ